VVFQDTEGCLELASSTDRAIALWEQVWRSLAAVSHQERQMKRAVDSPLLMRGLVGNQVDGG